MVHIDTKSASAPSSQEAVENASPKMKTWSVTLPIAGHACLVVEAETEEDAIDAALGEVTIDHLESWEAIPQFNRGNVCYCPRPWEAEAVDDTPDED